MIENKTKVTISILIVLIIFFASLSGVFAYFYFTDTEETMIINDGGDTNNVLTEDNDDIDEAVDEIEEDLPTVGNLDETFAPAGIADHRLSVPCLGYGGEEGFYTFSIMLPPSVESFVDGCDITLTNMAGLELMVDYENVGEAYPHTFEGTVENVGEKIMTSMNGEDAENKILGRMETTNEKGELVFAYVWLLPDEDCVSNEMFDLEPPPCGMDINPYAPGTSMVKLVVPEGFPDGDLKASLEEFERIIMTFEYIVNN